MNIVRDKNLSKGPRIPESKREAATWLKIRTPKKYASKELWVEIKSTVETKSMLKIKSPVEIKSMVEIKSPVEIKSTVEIKINSLRVLT
ncbi:hypothetical protein C2G38_2214110 [Gigaspora rosea]|uniref:Uncharacterized protein n=1 Tax=Gigaspora rosea TaxID=44941 RepID=A0A397UB97_9GLOM|nr:hypothetical protein C2G38_2214110 [Gigaspora rosea]